METSLSRLTDAMIEFDRGDARRIQHFLKVWAYAKLIGEMEGLDPETQFILESAAIVHDIGIHACEAKYGHTGGKQQEEEGAPLAKKLLEGLGFESLAVERVCQLVGCHHTYTNVSTIEHQILLEADFLVNSFEDNMIPEQIQRFCDRVFKTKSGIRLMELQYGLSLAMNS